MKLQAALDRANSNRADITTQAALGAQIRAADDERRKAPITTLQAQTDMFSGLPLSLFSGSVTDATGTSNKTSKETGASLGEIAQLVSALTSFMAKPAVSIPAGGQK